MNSPAISAASALMWMWSGRPGPRKVCSRINESGNFYDRSIFALCALLLILTPWASAQRAAGHAASTRPAFPHFNLPAGSHAFAQSAHLSRFRPSPYTSLPFPFFTDFFNPDDIYSTGYPVASEPPIVLLKAARDMAGSREYFSRPENYSAPTSPQPLVIELQNGRYVRINSTPANGEVLPQKLGSIGAQDATVTSHHSNPSPTIAASSPAHDLLPAVLVFRDGHSEEVRDYTIADGILYARGDFYIDGYWNKKIALSTLNLAQTFQANSARNVKFVLPTSPNEVITRP
jgi:hypothetical protein